MPRVRCSWIATSPAARRDPAYVVPPDRAFGTLLYEIAVHKIGWNNPRKPLLQLHPDPRGLTLALMRAREFGDATTVTRLRKLTEDSFEPKFFGAEGGSFRLVVRPGRARRVVARL